MLASKDDNMEDIDDYDNCKNLEMILQEAPLIDYSINMEIPEFEKKPVSLATVQEVVTQLTNDINIFENVSDEDKKKDSEYNSYIS